MEMNSEPHASAAEVLRMAQGGRARPLPERGDKFSRPPAAEDAWLESQRLRARSEELLALIGEPLVAKRSELYSAAWDPVRDVAEVATPPGKFWQYMGFEEKRRKFLHWEEALLLSELGVLQLTVDGQRCSLQEARARLLAGCDQRERQYRLYAHLSRLDYRPVRHQGRLATAYERQIRLDQYIRDRRTKRKRTGSAAASPEPKQPCGGGDDSGDSDSDSGSGRREQESVAVAAGLAELAVGASGGGLERTPEKGADWGNDSTPSSGAPSDLRPVNGSGEGDEPLKRLDFTEEKRLFPNFYGCADRVTVRPPDAHLLPPNVCPRNEYLLDVAAVRRGPRAGGRSRDSQRDRYPSCLPVLTTPARNWTEFKAQAALLPPPARRGRPAGGGSSLVPADWRGSTAELLSLLRLAPPAPPPPAAARPPPPLFDVYPAAGAYRKSAPPPPEFRVFVVRPDDEIGDLTCPVGDGVPLCAAVLGDTGTPALYTVQQGSLPVESSVLDLPL